MNAAMGHLVAPLWLASSLCRTVLVQGTPRIASWTAKALLSKVEPTELGTLNQTEPDRPGLCLVCGSRGRNRVGDRGPVCHLWVSLSPAAEALSRVPESFPCPTKHIWKGHLGEHGPPRLAGISAGGHPGPRGQGVPRPVASLQDTCLHVHS